MNKRLFAITLNIIFLGHGVLSAMDVPATADAKSPFYPQFCFGFGASDSRYTLPAEQIRLLRELGYDGYSHYGIDGLSDVLKALDEHHLKLFQFYIQVSLAPGKPKYDARLKEALALLKGRDTVVSLLMDDKTESPAGWEREAADAVREIADLAAAFHLRVAVYPYYKSVQEAVCVARKAERKNVGVIFSLAFFSLTEDEKDIEATLKSAMPWLYAVNINGTESGYKGKDFLRLIQTLDRGSFDNLRLLRILEGLGYSGPIGLHCCYIPGDVRDNLTRSMKAWNDFSARLRTEPGSPTDSAIPLPDGSNHIRSEE